MNRIDIHNYEAYLLDFSEGNLGGELQMELELFLIQHPELNIDLGELTLVELNKEEIFFPKKNNLKKSESDLISETQFISYIENQIPLNERLKLEKSCDSNPYLANELSLYQQTITHSDLSITYSDKNELKRRSRIIWFDFSVSQYAAAACILFLIGLFVLWPKSDTINLKSELAEHKKNEPVVKDNSTSNQKKEADQIRKSAPIFLAKNSKQRRKTNISNASSISNVDPIEGSISQKKEGFSPIEETQKNETLMATNNSSVVSRSINQTVVQVITENEEESMVSNTSEKKKGIWALASKALKNLNQVGIKSVNGDEDANQDKTSYALTLGGLNITHKAGSL